MYVVLFINLNSLKLVLIAQNFSRQSNLFALRRYFQKMHQKISDAWKARTRLQKLYTLAVLEVSYFWTFIQLSFLSSDFKIYNKIYHFIILT